MKTTFSHVRDWVFDLDNTLYPGHCNLFVQVDKRITQYVMRVTNKDFDEAWRWQKHYYREYGTTLRGLMDEHGVDPRDYMDDVHDIDYSSIPPNPELGELIAALPGRKHIFTNGDVKHAQRTLSALDIEGRFDMIFDIALADFIPKPDRAPYDKFLRDHKIDPNFAVMFEDMPRNLEVPKVLGMTTVLMVESEGQESQREIWETEGRQSEHIDYVSDDINQFIAMIIQSLEKPDPVKN